ncbi:hypothetical protein K503DRAFT_244353 [Rhizopogon vinicolor AM-OR11-026]|uniref:Uncharacterized protein n=1 Tax=Rhizopogon vinicolor AM-OR11-026 TaxID=1314800 RepID=A0A1B7MXG3_9AGAM|nr:hypothetical protein K503DRAFT_244353 [Rhizopogon vinicolor AM-OR11-026]
MFRLVDKQTIVVISEGGLLTLYTLREPDGSPQRRITHHLPKLKYDFSVSYAIHVTPSFHSTSARTDLMLGYVPLLESQIMVLEFISQTWTGIFVIDMVIFSGHAIRSEMPVEIPWSDWGPHHTWCFPHYPNHQISVFGSKMAYTFSEYNSKPGERVNRHSQGHCYVHILDFNKRIITRAENGYDRSSPVPLIRKPDRVLADQSCFVGDIISNHPCIATVCCNPFKMHDFDYSWNKIGLFFQGQVPSSLMRQRFHVV